MANGRSSKARAGRTGMVVAAVVGGLATLVAALITIWSTHLSQSATSGNIGPVQTPTITATATVTATPTDEPTETPSSGPAPQVTVTVTAGPDIRVVLPSSLAISVDSGAAPSSSGDGGSGLITALGGFLTGVGAVITGVVTWFSLRRRQDDDEEPDKTPASTRD